jgi:orotate phosphoribosyltransferase
MTANRLEERRVQALASLEGFEVLMRDGHFDYGNGFHGRVYLNPHQLFRQPSTIWRLAQDLLDMLPADVIERTEIVAGPSIGGALLAHTMAGLVDSRRPLTHLPCSFAPLTPFQAGAEKAFELRGFYARLMQGRRVLLADDVRNTGRTFQKCAELVENAGGIVLATVEIFDRLEAIFGTGAPNYSLVEYRAPENHPAAECPMCKAGQPVTVF